MTKPLPHCAKCFERSMVESHIDRNYEIRYDGEIHLIEAKQIPVLICNKGCDCILFNNDSEEVIHGFLREKVNILSPDQIRGNRVLLKLSLHQLAYKTGLTIDDIDYWERGYKIQSRQSDKILREALDIH